MIQCSRHGASLASIHDAVENDFILCMSCRLPSLAVFSFITSQTSRRLDYAGKLNVSRLLIGLRQEKPYEWEWMDGSPQAYTFWNSAIWPQPSHELCAHMLTNFPAKCRESEHRLGCWTSTPCYPPDVRASFDVDDEDKHDAICQRASGKDHRFPEASSFRCR